MPKRSGKLPSVNRGGLAAMAESGHLVGAGNRHQRRIFDKKDLMEAVRRLSPGRRSQSTPQLRGHGSKKGGLGRDGSDTSRTSASNASSVGAGKQGGASSSGADGRRSLLSSSGATKRRPPPKSNSDGSAGGGTLAVPQAAPHE